MKTSGTISSVTKALNAFQTELRDPAKTATNPAFKSKYIPLDDIILAIRSTANKHGLVFQQEVGGDGTNISVSTRVSHESGEWMETEPLVVHADQTSIQKSMSAITYSKRYSLSAFVLLASGDPDDDGNEAEGKKVKNTIPSGPVEKWPESAILSYQFLSPSLKGLSVRKCMEIEKDEPGHGIEWLNLVDKATDSTEEEKSVANRAKFLIRVPEAR